MIGRSKTKVCAPTFSSTTGTQKTLDFGKTWSLCNGFSCQNGYSQSGDSCIISVTPNTTCWYTSTNFSTETPYCGSYTTTISSISIFSTISIWGYSEWTTSFPYKVHYHCPNKTNNSTWNYNEILTQIGSEQLVYPSNYPLYADIQASFKSSVKMNSEKRLYGTGIDFNQLLLSGVCTQI